MVPGQLSSVNGAYTPNFGIRIVFAVPLAIRECCHPARVQQDRLGLLVLQKARLLPRQNGFGEPHIVAVAVVDGDVRIPGVQGDDIHVAEAPLDDFNSKGFKDVNVSRVTDECDDFEVGVGFD